MSSSLAMPLIAVTIAGATLLAATYARADHQGQGSVHVGAAVELGPRLSTRLETTVPESSKPSSEEAAPAAVGQANPVQPMPKRNVRVVYPGPFSN